MAIGDSWRVVRDSKGGAATEEAATSSAVLVGAEYSKGQDQAQGCSLLGLELVRAGIARRVRVRVRAAGQGCGQGYTSRVQVSVRARLRFGPRTGATKAQSQVGLGLAKRSRGGYSICTGSGTLTSGTDRSLCREPSRLTFAVMVRVWVWGLGRGLGRGLG